MPNTVKHAYEAVIIYSVSKGEESVEALKERIKTLIEENAEITKLDEWGKRRLAYLINDEADGYYVLYRFNSTAEFPAELDRVSKITEGVLRWLVVRDEQDHTEAAEPSAPEAPAAPVVEAVAEIADEQPEQPEEPDPVEE